MQVHRMHLTVNEVLFCILLLFQQHEAVVETGDEYLIAAAPDKRHDFYISLVAGDEAVSATARGVGRTVALPYTPSYFLISGMATFLGVDNKGLAVVVNDTSSSIHGEYTHSVFSPLPIISLGTRYIVASCYSPNPGYGYYLVIATHSLPSAVNVTFIHSTSLNFDINDKVYINGSKTTVMLSLEPYQTYTHRSYIDLTGTIVTSIQTIAVFTGMTYNDEVVGYDQLIPVQHYGQEYVVAVDDYPAYQLVIVSEHHGTQIVFNDGTNVTMGNNGTYRHSLPRNARVTFSSSSPVMTTLCAMLNYSSTCCVIPPVEAYTTHTVFFSKKFKIVTTKDAVVSVTSNSNVSLPVEWMEIPGSRFVVGSCQDSYIPRNIEVNSTSGFTVLIDSYGYYTSGYKSPTPVVIDGGLGGWSQWEGAGCSVTCGRGTEGRVRSRTCSRPFPENGGENCTGHLEEFDSHTCSETACDGDTDTLVGVGVGVGVGIGIVITLLVVLAIFCLRKSKKQQPVQEIGMTELSSDGGGTDSTDI